MALACSTDLVETNALIEISNMRNVGNQGVKHRRTIPSLDGLRAISIALVILSHAQGTQGFPTWIPRSVADHGALGVHIFFVISGFLITSLLLEEHGGTGSISLSKFYARRTLRIFPPFYIFLTVLAFGSWAGLLSVPLGNLLFAATYTMNYMTTGGMWITGHIWSLSVEEQFYLTWPLTMKFAGPERSCWIAATLAISAPLACLALYLINPNVGSPATKYFPFVADSIAAGCVLAGLLPSLRYRQRILRWFAAPLGGLIIPLILTLDLGRSHPRLHLAFTETALNLCICCAIVRYTEFPNLLAGRVLNNPSVAFVGKISYSLYLWQQIFMNPFGTHLMQTFPINVGASIACALVSYYLIELPTTGMRRRFQSMVSTT